MVKQSSRKRKDLIQLLLWIGILISVNFLSSGFFFRIDLTSEKRFTLSPQTKSLLKELDDVVFFRVYLEGKDFPAGFERLKNSTREMLDEFRVYSGNNIEYEFVDPIDGLEKKEQADVFQQLYKKGIIPAFVEIKEKGGTSQRTLFPGALATYKGREVPVQVFRDQLGTPSELVLHNSIQSLEYELSNAIRKLQNRMKPKVAFLTGHGEWDTLSTHDIREALREYYDVHDFMLDGRLANLELIGKYKAVIMARPDSMFSPQEKFILDQYIMNGGKALFFYDPVFARMDSLTKSDFTYGIPRKNNLEDMFFKYGVRFNFNLVQDIRAGMIPIPVNMKYQYYPWMFFPLAGPGSEHPICKNLNVVKCEFVSSIDTLESPALKKTILLKSSKYANILNTPVYINIRSVLKEPNEKQFRHSDVPFSVLVEGSFESLFKFQALEALDTIKGFTRLKDSKPTSLIFVADADIIANKIQASNQRPLPLGYDIWTKQSYGNKNFVLNAINYLCDDEGLLSVRSRELTLRILDRKKAEKDRTRIQILNTAAPLALVLIAGLITSLLRKRKYTK
jgi:ABC-2 type transport system permease protein